MKVRIEVRREEGRFVARCHPQAGFTGHRSTARKTVQGCEVVYPSVPGNLALDETDTHRSSSELFEALISAVQDKKIRFMGWEIVNTGRYVRE